MRLETHDLIRRWLREYDVRGPVADCGGASRGYYGEAGGMWPKPIFDAAGLDYISLDSAGGEGVLRIDLMGSLDAYRAYQWGSLLCIDMLHYVRDPIRFGENLAVMVKPGAMLLATAPEHRPCGGDWDHFRYTPNGLRATFGQFEPLETGRQSENLAYSYMIGRRR